MGTDSHPSEPPGTVLSHPPPRPPSRSGESRPPPVLPEPTKLRLTLYLVEPKPFQARGFFATNRKAGTPPQPLFHHLQGLCGPARRGAEPFNQGFGAVEDRHPSLYILQPGIVGLGRLAS